jgi:hypothetical protein
MIDQGQKALRLSIRPLWMVLILAGLIVAVWWADRWRSTAGGAARSSPAATAQAGDVKRESDGRLLYFDGRRWTNKPMPAQDTPF